MYAQGSTVILAAVGTHEICWYPTHSRGSVNQGWGCDLEVCACLGFCLTATWIHRYPIVTLLSNGCGATWLVFQVTENQWRPSYVPDGPP